MKFSARHKGVNLFLKSNYYIVYNNMDKTEIKNRRKERNSKKKFTTDSEKKTQTKEEENTGDELNVENDIKIATPTENNNTPVETDTQKIVMVLFKVSNASTIEELS